MLRQALARCSRQNRFWFRNVSTEVNSALRNDPETQHSALHPPEIISTKEEPVDLHNVLQNTINAAMQKAAEEELEFSSTVIRGRAIRLPIFHPRTHSIPVATIHFRSHHIRQLDLMTHFATHAAAALEIPVSRVVFLPTERTIWTVPRSPFVHKKSQENFERKVHKRAIKAWDAHPDVVDKWLKYVETNGIGGVGMRFVTWDHLPVGFGKSHLAEVEAMLEVNSQSSQSRIKALTDKIIKEEENAQTSS